MKLKMKLIKCGVVAVGLAIGAGAVLAVGSLISVEDHEPVYTPYTYEINENGESLGDAASNREEMPDLIRVDGKNGIEGYARAADLFDREPTPYEFVTEVSGVIITKEGTYDINVYAEDGVTVIDTFTVGGAYGYEITRDSQIDEEAVREILRTYTDEQLLAAE
jgi:hypothetical protein